MDSDSCIIVAEKKKRKKKHKKKSNHGFDNESYDGKNSSIEHVKRSCGFGHRITTFENDYDRSHDQPNSPANTLSIGKLPAMSSIENEVRCVMCVDILYKPVSLSCGHSLCRLCLLFALKNMSSEYFDRFQCPICRKTVCVKCSKRFQINAVLWNLLCKLFPDKIVARDEAAEKKDFDDAWKEYSGMIMMGLGDPLANFHGDETNDNALLFVRVDKFTPFKRCTLDRVVVKDSNDLVMHLALAFVREPDPMPLCIRKGVINFTSDETSVSLVPWCFNVVILELEMDEDVDAGGFPAFLHDPRSESSRVLVKRSYIGSIEMEVLVDCDTGEFTSVGTTVTDFREGIAKLQYDTRKLPRSFSRICVKLQSVQWSGLKCQFEIQAASRTKKVYYSPSLFKPPIDTMGVNGFENERIPGGIIDIDESEDESEPENYDEYEDDGFVVMEGEEDDEESFEEIGSKNGDSCSSSEIESEDLGKKVKKKQKKKSCRGSESKREHLRSPVRGSQEVMEQVCSSSSSEIASESDNSCLNSSDRKMASNGVKSGRKKKKKRKQFDNESLLSDSSDIEIIHKKFKSKKRRLIKRNRLSDDTVSEKHESGAKGKYPKRYVIHSEEE